MPIDKGTSKPITQLSSLQINYKDQNSCFNPPIVTTKEREALVMRVICEFTMLVTILLR